VKIQRISATPRPLNTTLHTESLDDKAWQQQEKAGKSAASQTKSSPSVPPVIADTPDVSQNFSSKNTSTNSLTYVFFFFFLEIGSHCLAQAGLELRILLTSAFLVLELKACTIMPGSLVSWIPGCCCSFHFLLFSPLHWLTSFSFTFLYVFWFPLGSLMVSACSIWGLLILLE
jgi:hypothetical protein